MMTPEEAEFAFRLGSLIGMMDGLRYPVLENSNHYTYAKSFIDELIVARELVIKTYEGR